MELEKMNEKILHRYLICYPVAGLHFYRDEFSIFNGEKLPAGV